MPDAFAIAFPGRTFEGKVRYVGPALRRASRDLVVEALVDNHDKLLKPGLFAVARIVTGEEVLPVVPKTALRQEGGAARVLTANKGRLEERVVQPGLELEDGVAIRAGVTVGDRIVAGAIEGVKQLKITVDREGLYLGNQVNLAEARFQK